MKPLTGLVVLLVMLFGLAACGGGAAPAAPAEVPAAPAAPAEAPAAPAASDDGYGSGYGSAPAAAAPTEAPAPTEAAAPTEAPAADAPAASESSGTARAFVIVPSESQVAYAVNEQFLRDGIRDFTAIGVTQEVEGTVTFDPANPQKSSVGPLTINISTFKSDDERRDNAIRDRWLESARFPLATFTPTSIEGLPESYTEGEEITIQITGDLTVRDVTKPVTFETTGVIAGNEMRGTATTNILMTDFGFDPPSILNVLRAENGVAITFDFVARAN
mgnify:CR=1 FL=1